MSPGRQIVTSTSKPLPDLESLQRRHAAACDLKQAVDQEKIAAALREWSKQIGAPAEVRIIFVASMKESARAAWDARAAMAARAAWAARAAMAARDARAARAAMAARDARAAMAAWDAMDAWAAMAARAAWDARDAWDAAWISIAAIGAVSLNDDKTARIWLPVLEAFEAGAFAFWVTDAEIFVATIPAKVSIDDQRRLHCENGPAFVWLDDVRDYYWRGVNVPGEWIEDRSSLTAKTALSCENIEQRRAACEMLGWSKILNELAARKVDQDDPEIGALYECDLPGDGETPKITARFLRVRCGTGREFAVCVPPACRTAIEAQAWMQGREPQDFLPPEIRT